MIRTALGDRKISILAVKEWSSELQGCLNCRTSFWKKNHLDEHVTKKRKKNWKKNFDQGQKLNLLLLIAEASAIAKISSLSADGYEWYKMSSGLDFFDFFPARL